MFESKVSDLHMHLNGSLSFDFLEKTAEKNNVKNVFLKLKEVKEEYNQLIRKKSSEEDMPKKSIELIWKQFGLIHEIIQTLDDITQGTKDVVASSKASYMEIRTTPKAMNGKSWQQYVAAFVDGLKKANQEFKDKKIAYGLLSLDRTIHTREVSLEIIDFIVSRKKDGGLLVGIDLSGNPMGNRILTGDSLADVLRYALDKEIGIALHVGEVNTEDEKNDVDIILNVLSSWSSTKKSSENHFQGKVRLGHGIFLTKEQQSTIKDLKIPIEVCPTCHEKLNWWKKNNSHPIKNIYQLWSDPITSGTDDKTIFGTDAKEENHSVLKLFGYPNDEKKQRARIHQSKFRFTND